MALSRPFNTRNGDIMKRLTKAQQKEGARQAGKAYAGGFAQLEYRQAIKRAKEIKEDKKRKQKGG
jgi:hypothetical protein